MESIAAQHIAGLPEKLRPAVVLWLDRLQEAGLNLPDEFVAPLTRLLACSDFAGKVLLQDFSWFSDSVATFSSAARDDDLDRSAAAIANSDANVAAVKTQLRRLRNRQLLRILWRDVQQQSNLDETLRQLSRLADRLLDAATQYAERQLQSRFGCVRNAGGDRVPLVILGMGKLGGYELNFSSDIDVIFCYWQNGETDGGQRLHAQDYFARLARQVINLIDEVTADGFVFRIDTRLRPFGDSGPPVVSFSALESYLQQHGRDWERYAYVKARIVGPQPSADVADELYENLIHPFVYRRYLDYGVFESVRQMQSMIAAQVRRRELADNIKLGPGGIREAEFIVQALQLVRGGSEPTLQGRQLQLVLPLLVGERGITAADARGIRSAYRLLRRLENFIQAIRDEQTHDLPDREHDIDRERLCLAMNYDTWDDLLNDVNKHRKVISAQFDAIAIRGQDDERSSSSTFSQLWRSRAGEQEWANKLAGEHAQELAQRLVRFSSLSAVKQIDAVSDGRLQRFVPALLERVQKSRHPVPALSRTLAVTEKILRRSAYLALLNENPNALTRLVDLCARSQYIADQIERFPALLDELLAPRIYSEGLTKDDLAGELQHRLDGYLGTDSESIMQIIAQFQRAAMFHIAVADFNAKLPIMKVSDALTWLAEVVLGVTLAAAWDDLVARHGIPGYVVNGVKYDAGFGVVGYGKLGGVELSYGSDLDIVFLHDSKGERQVTNGSRALDNTMFFSRLVRRLVHFLTTQTASGKLYEVDTRLRPDGQSGLLVSSVEAFEHYQEENAWTWEHQALLRARAVAGSDKISLNFERIRSETLSARVNRDSLRDDVVAMRKKMRKQLDGSTNSVFDLKHGRGGIGDIEFLVQYLVLKAADTHPEVIVYSDNIRQLDALVAIGRLEAVSGERLQEIYRGYRLYLHHRALDSRDALCDAGLFESERDFVAASWSEWLD